MISLLAMRCFRTLAREKSFTRSADTLFVAQQTLMEAVYGMGALSVQQGREGDLTGIFR